MAVVGNLMVWYNESSRGAGGVADAAALVSCTGVVLVGVGGSVNV